MTREAATTQKRTMKKQSKDFARLLTSLVLSFALLETHLILILSPLNLYFLFLVLKAEGELNELQN